MCCSHLLEFSTLLDEGKIRLLREYFASLTPNTKEYIMPSKIMKALDVNYETSVKVLLKLESVGYLERYYGVRCPMCSMLIKKGDTIDALNLDSINACYSCDREIHVTRDDLVIIFRLIKNTILFSEGQQGSCCATQSGSAVVAPQDRYVLFEEMVKSLNVLACNAESERQAREVKKQDSERDKEYERKAICKYKKNIKISIFSSFMAYLLLVGIITYVYKRYGFDKISIFATFGSSLIPFGTNYVLAKFFPQDIELIKRILKSDIN